MSCYYAIIAGMLFLQSACSAPVTDEIYLLIGKREYEAALALVQNKLAADKDNFSLLYLKAEILTHLCGAAQFRVQAIALTVQFGHHLNRYRSKRASREKLNMQFAMEAAEIYERLAKAEYKEPSDGRDAGYFWQAAGWLHLALKNYSKSENCFNKSMEKGDLWDVRRSLMYLISERGKK